MNKVAYGVSETIEPVLQPEDIFAIREVIDKIHVDEKINKYIVDLIFATRYPQQYGIDDLEGLVEYGASPRASIYLNKLARVYAFLQGRGYVIPNDIKSIGMDVLRHRVLVTFEAEAEEKTSEDIVERIFDSVRFLWEIPVTAIPKEILKKVRQIEIQTRRLVNDLLAGEYHSTFKGMGMEFSEVREYVPGDDIRTIDWNVTARMNKPFVKQFVEERELTVILLVDISASGQYSSQRQTKNEIAAELSALLALSAIRNNDKVGLILFTDRVEKFIAPKKR